MALSNGDILLWAKKRKGEFVDIPYCEIQIYAKDTFKLKKALKLDYGIAKPKQIDDNLVLFDILDSDNGGVYNIKSNAFKISDKYKKSLEEIEKENNYKNAINSSDKYDKYSIQAIELNDGNILLLGAYGNYGNFVFYPKSKELKQIDNFRNNRSDFSAVLLSNQDAVILGGTCGNSSSEWPFNEVEKIIYSKLYAAN